MNFRPVVLCAIAAVMAALFLAACGEDSTSSTSTEGDTTSTETSSSETSADYAATLKRLYEGEFNPPPSSGPEAQSGKTVWYISCGQVSAACAESSAAFEEASEVLGWKTTIVDSKVDYAVYSDAIRRAIAAKVDGVVSFAADCAQIQSALEEAKDAGLPVVAGFNSDCGEDGQPGEPLFAANMLIKDLPHGEFRKAWGRARAEYTIAKANGEANVIDAAEQTRINQKLQDASYRETIEECPGCEVSELKYTFADAGPTMTAKVRAALAQDPEANVISAGNDFIAAVGIAQGLEQTGNVGKVMLIGSDGGKENYELIRKGVQTASIPYSYPWASWAMADLLNRIFAGEPAQNVKEGGGWQAVDADHNLPPDGQSWEVPIDFRAAYEKIWGGG